MKILYAAELTGKAGVFTFKKALNGLRKKYPWNFMVVCADGATAGTGLGQKHAAYIHKLGADALTLGDYCFMKKDLTENLKKIPYVIRPANLNKDAPGFGYRIFNAGNEKIAFAVFTGQNGLTRFNSNNPFTVFRPILEILRKETHNIIVDFHAQASAEKKTFFYAVDGLCSAVIGSHTRVQTADETILPGGTAVITDAGRTGSLQSVGGCDINSRITEYLTGIPDWTKDAWEDLMLQGVYLDIGKDGKAISIERVQYKVDAPA